MTEKNYVKSTRVPPEKNCSLKFQQLLYGNFLKTIRCKGKVRK